MNKLIRYRKGFTLLELVIAAGLTAIMATAVVVVLGRGLTAWKTTDSRLQKIFELKKSISLFEKDLRNAAAFDPIPFEGKAGEWIFTSAQASDRLSAIGYRLAPAPDGGSVLERTVQLLDQEPQPVAVKQLLSGVKEARVQYAAFRGEQEKKNLEWIDAWDSAVQNKQIPRGIRLAWVVSQGSSGPDISFSEEIWIPQGAWGVIPNESA